MQGWSRCQQLKFSRSSSVAGVVGKLGARDGVSIEETRERPLQSDVPTQAAQSKARVNAAWQPHNVRECCVAWRHLRQQHRRQLRHVATLCRVTRAQMERKVVPSSVLARSRDATTFDRLPRRELHAGSDQTEGPLPSPLQQHACACGTRRVFLHTWQGWRLPVPAGAISIGTMVPLQWHDIFVMTNIVPLQWHDTCIALYLSIVVPLAVSTLATYGKIHAYIL